MLSGGGGADTLIGGLGKDTLMGGAGQDVFQFNSAAEAGRTLASRDVIVDFKHLVDKIDISGIDPDAATPLDQSFTFIGTQGFSHSIGELRYTKINLAGTVNDITLVEGDSNGDGVADLRIELKGLVTLTGGDFVL